MAIYRILVPITGFVAYEVKAESVSEAKELILEGCGESDSRHSKYNESVDSNDWSIEEVN